MADLVGPAFLSAFLQVAFDRLASPDVLLYFKRRKLNREFLPERLKIVLLAANAVLNDAEEKQFLDSHVKEWLDELKDAVYVADDLLDEIYTEALRSKSEAWLAYKVRGLIPFSTLVNSFDKRIQVELEEILGRLKCIIEQKDILGLKEVASGIPSRQLTTSCPEVNGVYGRDVDKEKIFELLQSNEASDHEICVVPIVGMAGVGKTTLAQLVYNDMREKECFDHTCWYCVTENFDVFRILKAIFEQVALDTCDIQDLNLLQLKIRKMLRGKKIFLVLDDVWNEKYNDWEELLRIIRCGAQEIKIIVTARNENVASVVGTVAAHHLKQLSDNDCWFLFAKHAFKNRKSCEFPDIEVIARGIVQKCKGLPLAAKTLGGLLRSKQDPMEWENVLKSDIWDLPEVKSDILPALRLSYHYLPSHLKRCFAYCSIFPKGYKFKKEELVLLWMAEDLLPQSKGNGRMGEIGERYFDDLASRSFFQRSNNHTSFFIMHDLVNDLAKFISREFCFRLEIDESWEITRKTRHLSYVVTKFDTSKKFEVCFEAKGLRTFLGIDFPSSCEPWCGKIMSMMIIDDLLLPFKRLRVLSLSTSGNVKDLPNSVANLKHLRYLDLSSTSIKQLPDFVCTLYNLQTLLLRDCIFLIELPTDLGRLVNLRHLDIGGTNLKEMPLQMGKLRNLQKLTTFVVGKDSGSSIKELRDLQHLSGTLSILNLENVHEARDAMGVNLKNKQYLSELVFKWGRNHENSVNERSVLEELCPHTKLKFLTIEGYGGTKFPDWLEACSFSKLESIRLSNCKYCSSLPPLGDLPSLKKLYIEGFHDVSFVDRNFYKNDSSAINPFRSLEVLSFEDMPEWSEWFLFEGDSGVFSTLQKLCIINCPKLRRGLPDHLPSLTQLKIEACQQLVASIPRAPDLHKLQLTDCDKVLLKELPPMLSSLHLGGCCILKSFAELIASLPGGGLPTTLESLKTNGKFQLPRGNYYPSLKKLEIWDGCDSLWSFPLEFYPELKYLHVNRGEHFESFSLSEGSHQDLTSLIALKIWRCPNFVSFPTGLCMPYLTSMDIINCKSLKLLPERMCTLLPSLVSLQLCFCPELVSFPEGGLPSNLKRLQIGYCDKLISHRMEWGLQNLHSLKEFSIWSECEDVEESFPEEALLPPTLTEFSIHYFPNLKSLNAKGFQNLTSLERLAIGSCNNLLRLPEEGLPASLSFLILRKCPLLEGRCQRDKGEDWLKIAHIPFIQINDEVIT